MSKISQEKLPEVFISSAHIAGDVYRLKKRGLVRNITGKLYTSNMTDTIENIATRRLWEIIGLLYPHAIIADRTAFEMKPTQAGEIFIISSKVRPVSFGNFIVYPRKGAPPLEQDMSFMGNLFVMSEARKYLENMRATRVGKASVSRFLSADEMEEKLDTYVRNSGEDGINRLRDQMRRVAEPLGLESEFGKANRLISGLLRTNKVSFHTPAAIARSLGDSFDPNRVLLFTTLYNELIARAPMFRKTEGNMNEILCFYEAYFSNYIEGTTFTVEEAADIIFGHKMPEKRPEDAHDIAGTYDIVASIAEMKKTPRDFDEFIDLLKRRHQKIMMGRPGKNPGVFKDKANQAGSTLFVRPEAVMGTLKEGFNFYQKLDTAFAKAVFMMFMVSEVHPFNDGNGRISRIMMNAELVARDEHRVIIPTAYRDNYLSALKGLSHNQRAEPYIKMLDFAQKYTAMLDWSNLRAATDMLQATNAFSENIEMDRLRLPTES